jgi:hypothetical protein
MKTLQVGNSVNRSPLRCGFIIIALALAGFALLPASGAVAAGTSALEGIVKDPAGHPIKGADVRIEAKNFSKIVKTDAAGHYTTDGLAIGTYKVTLVVNGTVRASILNAKTESGKRAQLNFDLTANKAPVKKHMVWVPPDTGTLIGGGRWVEVDDNGNIVNNGANNVQKSSGSSLSGVTQSHGGHTVTGGGP